MDETTPFIAFIAGFMLAVFLCILIAFLTNLLPAPSLTDCAREHDVYQCELVAVPMTPENDR